MFGHKNFASGKILSAYEIQYEWEEGKFTNRNVKPYSFIQYDGNGTTSNTLAHQICDSFHMLISITC